MTRGLSLWLDVLRVAATLVVVLSHLAYPRFSDGRLLYLRDLNLGSDAVIVFFVLSGFVIAHAADRDATLPVYAFNRLTRLLSVLAPALVLTLLFDRIGVGLRPGAYPAEYYNPLPPVELLLRGLTFSNEWALPGRVRLGSNGPLWSLSYEAAYYMLFGAAMFLRGPLRAVVLATVAIVAGPNVLLLLPAWAMGVLLWRHLVARRRAAPRAGVAWLLAAGAPALYVLALWADIPDLLMRVTAAAMFPLDPARVLAFSDEFLWNAVIGVLTVLHLLGMARLTARGTSAAPAVRWLAGACFSTYVTHYPALQLLDAALPDAMPFRILALLGGALSVGLVFASVFERRIDALRHLCVRLGAGPAPLAVPHRPPNG